MQNRGEARNTHHGSSFKVMNSNKSSSGCLLRDKKSIWPPGCTSLSHAVLEAWLSGDVPLTLYVAHSTQSQSHIQLPPFTRSFICRICFYSKRNLPTLWCDLRALWYFHVSLYLLGHHQPQQLFYQSSSPLLPQNWGEKPWWWLLEVAEGVSRIWIWLLVISTGLLTFPPPEFRVRIPGKMFFRFPCSVPISWSLKSQNQL